MSETEEFGLTESAEKKPSLPDGRKIMGRLLSLSGSEALNFILDNANPGRIVRSMTKVDLFWLIKKIGEEDSIPLLRLATNDQWQYILDMELWRRDRIDLKGSFEWMERLHEADPGRLARWLFSEDGNPLAHFYFFNAVQVVIKDDPQDPAVPEGFRTFDGFYYFRILDKEHEAKIEQILRSMSREDYNRYHGLLLGLTGVLPAELEEEMYRLKSVRLAEEGYLPFEEALSVYSYQKAGLLKKDRSEYMLLIPEDEEVRSLVPITPLFQAPDNNILAESIAGIHDVLLLDRLRLEFAGLCNQIFSADGVRFDGIEVLKRISRKAAGYINIGLELLSEGNREVSEQFIRNHPLISIFQVGFSRTLELKWEAERWLRDSWFMKQGFDLEFWGEEWGGTLKGVVKMKPLFFSGLSEADNYRDFESLSEVETCGTIIRRSILLDGLMERISSGIRFDEYALKDPLLTFHPILFNFWACRQLGLEQHFTPLSLDQVKDFFALLRKNEKKPPYRMRAFKETFIRDLFSGEEGLSPGDGTLLKDTLSLLWKEFQDEYALVRLEDLDRRYTKYLLINPDP